MTLLPHNLRLDGGILEQKGTSAPQYLLTIFKFCVNLIEQKLRIVTKCFRNILISLEIQVKNLSEMSLF